PTFANQTLRLNIHHILLSRIRQHYCIQIKEKKSERRFILISKISNSKLKCKSICLSITFCLGINSDFVG
ncbi:MAG: hypothetical protein QXZ09_05325, partial [Candidatus Methanomethylicaceae archaeon]